ncbi:TIGR03619 family F420-dependent LLM class oxidoreductase [Natronosalvus halobius]|uniref:TIGR03619 family F420-dependent LLM class oxidoreductase n=1 Tax=Natronosalvus halobius TaxID=2953746 RepID=UPI0020A20F15|nr:TIGR03619 family F420-dependent LLM class oxidoreductase [Natronosalvus halobius]USZ73698.1 TIGR03619 family F420-dependent LLM class oxidoreductase [Natronosalvus halobius]
MNDDSPISFGYALPGFGTYERPEAWKDIVQAAEAAGFETLWTGDHITIPAELDYDEYQFGVPDWADISNPSLDVFGKFSYISAVTDEIHMATNICIVPLRNPILLAKQALTVSALSDGRFELGVGSGWLRSEFEVLDAPFKTRGPHTDEFLEMFERIFENDGETGFDGEHINFRKTGFHPLPDKKPKIWVGGTSGAALRRTAEFGDGWTVVERDAAAVANTRDRLMNAWTDYDRDGVPEISARCRVHVGDWNGDAPDVATIGDPESIVNDVEAYADAGTTHFIVGTMTDSLEAEIEQIHRIGDEIIPAFE